MLVVVGGRGRKIGKSSVVTGLIRALPEARWTAVKISRHGHDAGGGHSGFVLREETAPGATDSGRYLAAGAVRSYWLQATGAQLEEALPAIRRLLGASENAIIESNSILGYLAPDLHLVVVDEAGTGWKEPALRQLDRGDAFVVVSRGADRQGRRGIPGGLPEGRPCFVVTPPGYVSDELVACVGRRLRRRAGQLAKGKATSREMRRSGPE